MAESEGDDEDPRVYQALALPDEALEKGGLEILRVGLIEDELYISARPVLERPSQWGEVLAEAARRLGAIYAAQTQGLSKKDVTVQIAEAFAADMGAVPVKHASRKRRNATAKETTTKKSANKRTKKISKTSKPAARKKR
jgi:hypothetical protein